jgi:hypothetical protein
VPNAFLNQISLQSDEMSNERQPLLISDADQHSTSPRPDLRNSPENIIVDGAEDEKIIEGE